MKRSSLGRHAYFDEIWVFRAAQVGLFAIGFAALASAPGPRSTALAQERANPVLVLPPVSVTARKREELEQGVPIGMSVLDGERVGDILSSSSNASLARSAPNVNFVDIGGQSANLFSIRGVGSFSPISSDDTSSVMYVGEAPQSVYGAPPSLLDVGRIEILRGPQGTLFGRNTQAGAINIIPNAPTFDRQFKVAGEAGTRDYGKAEFIANGPLAGDRAAGRLAARYSTFGGDVPNIATGEKDATLDIGAVRGSLLFLPDDNTTANLALTYNKTADTSPRFLLRDYADFPTSAVNPRTDIDSETLGLNFKASHDFGIGTFDSVTSLQRNTSEQILDPTDALVFGRLTGLSSGTFSAANADLSDADIDENLYSQEFRLSAASGSSTTWTLGVNYFRSELSADRNGRAATATFASTRGLMTNDFTTDSHSAFGEATVPIVQNLKGTLGFRGTHEHKTADYRFSGNGQAGVVSGYSQDSTLNDDFVTGRGALSYDWTPELMTYVSVARGYVSAGFPSYSVNNPSGRAEPSFPSSQSWTYEAGAKSELLNKQLSLKGAVFFNDVSNGHLVVFNSTAATFTIAALDYQSYGAETELNARLSPNWDLFGGIGYTVAELVGLPAAGVSGARSGHEVPNAPDITGTVGSQYKLSAAKFGFDGDFVGRLVWQYVGSRAADIANNFDLNPYNLVNLKLAWQGSGFEVYGFANNAFDERYEAWGQSFGSNAATVRVGQGRIVGVGASLNF
jgi:iron complex outermembrane receptor protein